MAKRGRPRTNCPPTEKLIELGKELVAWASEELPPGAPLRCRFSQWFSVEKGILMSEWDKMVEKEEFREYYEKAQALLAQKYLDGSVKESIGHRFLRLYFPELRRSEDKDHKEKLSRELDQKLKLLEAEFQLKIEQSKSLSPNDTPLTNLLSEIKKLNDTKPKAD